MRNMPGADIPGAWAGAQDVQPSLPRDIALSNEASHDWRGSPSRSRHNPNADH